MPQYSLQQFINDNVGNVYSFEAGGCRLKFTRTPAQAVFTDLDGNTQTFDGSTLNNIVVEYFNEANTTYQKHFIRIEQPSGQIKCMLSDPSEAQY